MARLAPKLEVLRALFALSGNQCAFPGCTHPLISDKGTFIAEICHIEAANTGGERYNPTQTDEQRRSFDNLLLLCLAHHRETDETDEFNVERLQKMKKDHEDQFRTIPYKIADDALTKAVNLIEIQLEKLYLISEDTNMVVHNIKATLENYISTTSPKNLHDDEVYTAQLEAIKELKKQAKYETIISMLWDFKEKNWEKISGEMKYKVLVNLGTCYLEKNDRKNACIFLLQLQDIQYETPECLSFLALGYSLAGEFDLFDKTFEKLLTLDKENSNAWVGYVERYRHMKKAAELQQEIPASLAGSIPLMFSLAGLLIDEGKRKEGVALLKKMLDQHQDNPEKLADTKALIGTRIIQILIETFKQANQSYTQEELDELEEARVMLTDAWNIIGETELAKSKYFIILNRGVIHKVTGRIHEASLDFQKAFDLSKSYLAFKNLFYTHIQLNNLPMAKLLMAEPGFKEALTEDEKFEFLTFRSWLLRIEDKSDEAIDLLKISLDRNKEEQYIELLTEITHILVSTERLSEAALWSGKLITEYPDYINGHLMSGHIAKSTGNHEGALQHYEKAHSLLTPSTKSNELYELAAGLTDLEQFEKAIPLFERIVNKNRLNEISRGLIHCYYNAGDLQAAFAIANNLFGMHPESVYLCEIVSNIYQEIKQYDKAIASIETHLPFAKEKPKDIFCLRAANLYFSYLKDEERSRSLLLEIKKPETFTLNESFDLAKLLVDVREETLGLKVALEARSRFYDNSLAHTKYMWVCFAVKREPEYLFPDRVRNNCAVNLSHRTGEEKLFLITDNQIKEENVLLPIDPFAQQLIGKSKNEAFTIKQSYGVTDSITITDIKDIYTHAVQETMALFKNRFAGEQGIGVFEYNPEDPLGSFEQVLRTQSIDQQGYERKIYELYNLHRATLGVLAGCFKRNAVMQWYAMQSSPENMFIAYTQNELQAIEYAISSNKCVVIELTALLTWFVIAGEKEFLPQLTNHCIVSQSTIDELQACYDELEQSAEDGMLNVAYEAGKVVSHQTPKETIIRHRALLLQALVWCKQHADVQSPNQLLRVNRSEREKMSRTLGDCFYDTLLLAEEQQAIVISDDDNFKNLLRNEKTPFPFSTYQFMQHLRIKELIDPIYFETFALKLIYANYKCIPLSGEQLWQCFDNSGFQLGRPFTVAVKGLMVMRPEFSALHLGHFLRKLYLLGGLTTTREQTILFILGEISKRQDFSQLKNFLIIMIEREFKMLPNFKDDILQLLSLF